MTEDEATVFEQDPLFKDYLRMRNWDDRAKIINMPLKDIQYYKEMVVRHLIKNNPYEN
jgi:predicted HD phosphohydrolase